MGNKIQSITAYLLSKKEDSINYVDDETYDKDISHYINKKHKLMVLNGDNGGEHQLLKPLNVDFEGSKFTTFNYEDDYSEKFGLIYNQNDKTFYSNTDLNFFEGNLGGEVCFENIGIGVKIPQNNIDIQGSWSSSCPSVVMGDGDVVFSIQGNVITSSLPVEVMGGSSDWTLEGFPSSSANQPVVTSNSC